MHGTVIYIVTAVQVLLCTTMRLCKTAEMASSSDLKKCVTPYKHILQRCTNVCESIIHVHDFITKTEQFNIYHNNLHVIQICNQPPQRHHRLM